MIDRYNRYTLNKKEVRGVCNIIVLVIQQNGTRAYYEFSSYEDFKDEFGFLSNYTFLQGAVLKGKLWDESKKWDELDRKIKRMHW